MRANDHPVSVANGREAVNPVPMTGARRQAAVVPRGIPPGRLRSGDSLTVENALAPELQTRPPWTRCAGMPRNASAVEVTPLGASRERCAERRSQRRLASRDPHALCAWGDWRRCGLAPL